jgi:hypothetical protein
MHKSNTKIFLVFLLFAFLTRFISVTFLLNYDEWYYLASWNGIKNGGVLYKTILDNKPPLAYFLYAIPDKFSLYITLSILSAIIAYFIGRIADNFYAGHIFLFITGAIPSYLELNLEYGILVLLLPAYYFILKKESTIWHIWAYFLCGASLMIKQHSLLLVIPITIYDLYYSPHLFKKSIYYILIIPILCMFYLIFTDTIYSAFLWVIDFNFWYKDLSETGGYIWKRFVYGQLFALPVYAGILIFVKNVKKSSLHILWISVFLLAVGSAWIGKELYLHYQILIFPFLILLFYQISVRKQQKYVYITTLLIFIFGQTNCLYTYFYNRKTWLTQIEGVISYEERKNIVALQTNKPIVFSAKSVIGLDYRKVKHIALCRSLEYLKKQHTKSKQLFTCDFYIKDALCVVSKSCVSEYVGDLPYKVVYEYEDNVGIIIEQCK